MGLPTAFGLTVFASTSGLAGFPLETMFSQGAFTVHIITAWAILTKFEIWKYTNARIMIWANTLKYCKSDCRILVNLVPCRLSFFLYSLLDHQPGGYFCILLHLRSFARLYLADLHRCLVGGFAEASAATSWPRFLAESSRDWHR